ncbi:hypothetical protein N7G274_007134 [Stereocaulon virgatum]|uniref:Uncharacterized protein n=1 Tax=Stereocaulon virgatum TaxID=373712 RepID=A0ABR4A5L8_9LECA
MPDFNETAVNQSFPFRNSPRPRDRSHERLPHDSIEQVYVRRRRSPRDGHSLSPPLEKGLPRLAARSHHSDSFGHSPRSHSQRSDSASSSPRHVRFDGRGRYDSSDSEDDHRHKADRRDLHMIPYPSDLPLKPYGAGFRRDDRHGYDYDYDSNSDSESDLSVDGAYKQERKMRNKKLLTIGLACITTIAAGNNIIQSTAAHHARQKLIEEGEMSMGESMKLRRRALMLDLIGVGVAAVVLNNARNEWKRVDGLGKAKV